MCEFLFSRVGQTDSETSPAMDDDEFNRCLEEFRLAGEKGQIALSILSDHASVNGLSSTQVMSTIDVLLQPSLTPLHRSTLLKCVLIPRDDQLLNPEVFWKLLAIVGPSEVYFRNGKPCKLRRLEHNCQVAILQWLIQVLPFFGHASFSLIRKAYPILIQLLSHEFSRAHISTLILFGFRNSRSQQARVVKTWHVKAITRISQKFPSDRSLFVLNWYICKAGLSQSSWSLVNQDPPTAEDLDSALALGSSNYILKHSSLIERVGTTAKDEIHCIWKDCELFRKNLKSDLMSRKKLKPNTEIDFQVFNVDVHAPLNKSTLWNITDLVHSLQWDPTKTLTLAHEALLPASKFKTMHLCLMLTNSYDSIDLKKKMIKLLSLKEESISQISLSSQSSTLRKFADFGGYLELGSLISNDLPCSDSSSNNIKKIKKQIEILPYLPIGSAAVLASLAIVYLLSSKSQTMAASFFESLTLLSRKNAAHLDINSQAATVEILNAMSSILPTIYRYTLDRWSDFDLEIQLGFTRFLRSLIILLFKIHNDWSTPEVIIPPRTLIYQLLFSINPLVVSEILYYISYLKTLKFEETHKNSKMLIHSFVYDGVNLLWKDLAFKCERTTFCKGMYLEPEFLHRITGLNFFGVSEFLLVRSIGGLARNPAFAYIFAEIVWSLEDSLSEISDRHPGPLSEDSVFRVQRDPDVSWVQMSYTDIKTSILYTLVESGFDGLGRFLCSSIKSLRDRTNAIDRNI